MKCRLTACWRFSTFLLKALVMDEDQRGEQTPKTDGGTESSPTIKDTQTNPTQDQGGIQHRDRKHFYWGLSRYESVSALIQGGLFFTTLIYMIFAGLQWCTLRESLMISMLISSRPWAVISEVSTNGRFVPSQELKVQMAWKNVGNSPALQFKTSIILAVIRTPRIDKESPECPDDAVKFQSISTLGPNIISYASHGITIEPGDLAEAIQRGEKTIIGCGRATYRDIIHADHQTSFCFLYDIQRQEFIPCQKEDVIY